VLGAGVEPLALSLLKYGLLALLFLFLWRATRWVMRGLTVDSSGPVIPAPGNQAASGDGPATGTLLVHTGDGAKPTRVTLDAATTIGRAPECELRLEDTYASQQHARIFARGTGWYVEDLGSTNGTFVNGKKLERAQLARVGDLIHVGETELQVQP
jgi:pSer/pThr/pTyr-binding forkhead associated (FHA) protein